MRTMLMTTALALSLAAGGVAFAQQDSTTDAPSANRGATGMTTAPSGGGTDNPAPTPGTAITPPGSGMGSTTAQEGGGSTWYNEVSTNEIVGQTLYGSEGEEIGEVSNVVMSQSSKQAAAVVGVGGFLGIGEREVTIPLDQIRRGQDNRLTTSMTKDQIAQLPQHEEGGDWLNLGADRMIGEGANQ